MTEHSPSRLMPESHGLEDGHGSNPYNYGSLEGSSDIRLLVLHSGSEIGEISCDLVTVFLEDPPAYFALSYIWGDPKTRSVNLKGGTIEAITNVYKSLWHFRREDEAVTLWADALCINQADVEERSSQVRKMGDIYSHAKKVIAWLGEVVSRSEVAFPALRKAASFLPELPEGVWNSVKSLQELNEDAQRNFLACDWKFVIQLLRNLWFCRKWVIQEVAKSKKVTVKYGDNELPWNTLAKVSAYLVGTGLITQLPSLYYDLESKLAWQNVLIMSELWQRREDVADEFIKLILETSTSKCTDPRDHIYALLTFAPKIALNDWELIPDYTLAAEDVFKRFARWCLFKKQDLLYLAATQDLPIPSELHLPSWVPDFSNAWNTNYIPLNGERMFTASRGSQIQASIIGNGDVLRIRGQLLDKVQRIGRSTAGITQIALEKMEKRKARLHGKTDGDEDLATEEELNTRAQIFYAECEEIAWDQDKSMSPSRKTAYWKTLTFETIDNERAPSKYGEVFDGLMFIIKADSQEDFERATSRVDFIETGKLQLSIAGNAMARRFCSTVEGRLGCVPVSAKVGDDICILFGRDVPCVIRARGHGSYGFVGQCYVHGIMDGEVMDTEGVESREFDLV